jgi:polyhydroxyalkanoate synthesis regulator phasin
MSREERLRAIIDELQYEHRKVEYGSALERLTRRVVKLEEKVEELKNKI